MEATQEVSQKALALPDQARHIAITDITTYHKGALFLKGIKGLRGEITAVFGPLKSKAHGAWKAICDEEKKAEAPLVEAEQIVKREMARYDTEQERIRREEQRRLEEEARKRDEEERLALALRMEAEAKAKQAEADALAAQNKPEEAQEAVVAAQAFQETAEQAIAVAAPVYVPPVAKTVPKVAGISYREVWKFEIVDAAQIPREYMVPDTTKIGGVVRALKGAASISGVRIYAEKITSVS